MCVLVSSACVMCLVMIMRKLLKPVCNGMEQFILLFLVLYALKSSFIVSLALNVLLVGVPNIVSAFLNTKIKQEIAEHLFLLCFSFSN